MRGVGGDASSVFSVISCLLNIATYAFSTICIGAFLFKTDIILAISIIIIGIACILLTVFLFKKKMAKLGRENRESSWLVSLVTTQIIYGIKEIFMKQKKSHFLEEFRVKKNLQRKVNIETSFFNTLPTRIIESISIFGIIVAVLIRMAMEINVQEFVSSLAVFAMAGFKIMPYISGISGELTSLVFYRPGLEAAYKDIMEVQRDRKSVV